MEVALNFFFLERNVQGQFNEVLKQEKILWFQKSREKWFAFGDRNTKFFHIFILVHRKRNKVQGLKQDNCVWCFDQEVLKQMVISCFKRLYTQKGNPISCFLTLGCFPRWNQGDYSSLVKSFTLDEIHYALMQMSPFKALGLDGFHMGFFQKMWDVIKDSLWNFAKNIFNLRSFPSSINKTLVALIPKVSAPKFLTQFRPISLYNDMYKLLPSLL